MVLIGLTGGIASGKSVVSARFAELGAVVVDADVLAREVVEPGTEGLAAIAERFGPSVIDAAGRLDRPALGAIIFSDEQARLDLNQITHPAIWKRATELFAEATAADPDVVIVYDVPLLVEASGTRPIRFDRVVVVMASEQTRHDRLVTLRGMDPDEASRRIASQATDDQRRAAADVLIDSDGSLEATIAQVDALWAELTV